MDGIRSWGIKPCKLYDDNDDDETWILKEIITNRLMVFERKILRKIFGPTYKNGSWRIKINQELDKLIKRKNIINFARVQRLGWYGHIKRLGWYGHIKR